MNGAISTADLLAHPAVTVRCFGWRVFLRAVFASRDKTFLSLLEEERVFAAARPAPTVLQTCIRLEYAAMRMYDRLAHRFADTPPVSILFAHLAEQEREHAELLEICAKSVKPDQWKESCFVRLQDSVPQIEAQIERVRASLAEITTIRAALALVVRLESSEINRVFEKILKASDSPFVKRLRPFRKSVRKHIAFICRMIPEMEPQLASSCQELRAATLG